MGPTIVSGSGDIQFQAIYLLSSEDTVDGAKWLNNNSAIDFNEWRYDKKTRVCERITQTVTIPNEEKNAGTYMVVFNEIKSNSIDVILGGMYSSN